MKNFWNRLTNLFSEEQQLPAPTPGDSTSWEDRERSKKEEAFLKYFGFEAQIVEVPEFVSKSGPIKDFTFTPQTSRGSRIEKDAILGELETDKMVMDLASLGAGWVVYLAEPGPVNKGTVLAVISQEEVDAYTVWDWLMPR
ncbi:biotin/lipoyl-containing protein [Pontibacter sp. G13]|uniref:biotin/lipoyl-containing protein n=1 Tax=Pontibacter sp. G13 TaxID=3074898 RepID=UPI00288A6305|nr:biotin/lipoyl-containing protein [Pontibacter sp. G13]WNJ18468.1 biotin/lipoyl-containing protein [Pontibacter sp. G13]